ncbi:MAG: NAD(+)/NADH kinase [Kiritimatiellia bacterium]
MKIGQKVRTVAVVANYTKPRASSVLRRIARAAHNLDITLVADEVTARLLGCKGSTPPPELFEEADAVLALGGDGTVLRTVRALNGRDVPIMGINIGGLGFLTSVADHDVERALDCLRRGDYITSLQTVEECAVTRAEREIAVYRALNEIVVNSGPAGRVVTLEVNVNDDYVTSYLCDGLIVATPVGSTGHSLSAGGPILTPGTDALIITLICPHTLSSRPLAIPGSATVRIRVGECSDEPRLYADGQVGQSLREGDEIMVRRSRKGARFIHLPGYSYFDVLRQKLHWRGKNV